ncbi:MAG: bi-domain-containing oxidoreductase [Pseudomonadota bacterium]
MQQAIIKNGKVLTAAVPAPIVSPGALLIKVVRSCISAGTELAGAQASGKSLIRRALQQPENIRKAFNMARAEGFVKTARFIKRSKESGQPTGYSIAGVVIGIGDGVSGFTVGDRVAAAGAGLANHAEYVDIPKNLVVKVPDGVDDNGAATVAVGSIAMHGVRRAAVQLGEYVVVFGTGLLGQLAVQMVTAAGGRVIAVDIDARRLEMATHSGAENAFNAADADCINSVFHATGGHGADAVLFCAATNDPRALSDALSMCRRKGRLVMVGVWGNEIRREDLYAKEIDFLISTSYGPGRYDDRYELLGQDYPYGYVRWTENRNMLEYLRLQAQGRIDIKPMLHAVFPIENVQEAFTSLGSDVKPLLVLLDYGCKLPDGFIGDKPENGKLAFGPAVRKVSGNRVRVGLIGAGEFARAIHLPNLLKLKNQYQIRAICNRSGLKARETAQQCGAAYATSDYREIIADPDVDLVMICTRHNLHGQMVLDSLNAGKHTFVEKPLCTRLDELEKIEAFYAVKTPDGIDEGLACSKPMLAVGFNRRFSPYAREIRQKVEGRLNPLMIHYRMNAGYIPYGHWVHTEEGGGRIIGEACHIIDLFSYLIGAPVKAISAFDLSPMTESIQSSDNKSVTLEYADGSVAVLQYFSVGSKDLPKERLELHFDGKTIVMDNYKSMQGFGIDINQVGRQIMDKGYLNELTELAESLKGGGALWPMSPRSIFETTRICIELSKW